MLEKRPLLDRKKYFTFQSVVLLWWAGFKDGIAFHRCVVYCVHDPRIGHKIAECFVLNGIFLISILGWGYLAPWIKQLMQASMAGWAFVDAAYLLLLTVSTVLWLIPVYFISYRLSCDWYQDIARLALPVARTRPGQGDAQPPSAAQRQQHRQRQGGVAAEIAHELFRFLMFLVFFVQCWVVSFVPFIGKYLYFTLLCWLYSLYSFDYKWDLARRDLQQRIDFFQQHWAFFLGFGTAPAAVSLYFPFFSGAAILAMVYPLVILVAFDSNARVAYCAVEAREQAAGRKLQIGR
ncbi:hypothetical protein WJX73_007266 [Symbiochloris irregularis]|uniref:Etoposide-induced protein 2.4-domain-containing protein n=1 Tax=Symbiochloris irregularis TaxID=706552 RepID=A0AAW1PKF6_9CHLO